MAVAPNMQQRRIINYFIRRNMQGWGRPLAFTLQRLRLGAIFFGIAVVLVIVGGVFLFGFDGLLHPGPFQALLTDFIILFALAATGAFWIRAVPQYFVARTQAIQEYTGVINAVICDVQAIAPFVTDHFITLRTADGRLRAFAIPPEMHDQVCVSGRSVTLVVIPGIDYVTAVKDASGFRPAAAAPT